MRLSRSEKLMNRFRRLVKRSIELRKQADEVADQALQAAIEDGEPIGIGST